jgi:flavin reductase (DIM6/NTAB) family NADH-FMN oxidoreductase RutF
MLMPAAPIAPPQMVDLRDVMSQFATGVTAVTLPGSPPHGITVNAFTSVSLDPPLVLICLDHDTEAHEKLSGGLEGYCVNILTRDQRHLGEQFAGMGDEDAEPFVEERTHAETTGAPVFDDALAYLDCSVFETVVAGDHTIYIGEVLDAAVLDADAEPLTFYESDWGGIERGA